MTETQRSASILFLIIPPIVSKTDQTKSHNFPLCSTELRRLKKTAAIIGFKETTRHFPLSKIIHLHSNRKAPGFASLKDVERDSGGWRGGSNMLKYATETKRVQEEASGL